MLIEQARRMLEDRLIPFWAALRDDRYGGFYGWMGYDLQVDRHAEKGCILNSRILWFFSRCAQELGREDCLELARHAYRFLTENALTARAAAFIGASTTGESRWMTASIHIIRRLRFTRYPLIMRHPGMRRRWRLPIIFWSVLIKSTPF